MTHRLLLVLLFSVSLSAAPPEPKPKVRLTFAIEGEAIRTALGAQATAYETKVATEVKCLLEKQFPYLDWVTSGSAPYELTLTMQQRQDVFDHVHSLQYRASIRAGDPPTHTMYEFSDPVPDPKDLQADLLKRIKADVKKSEEQTRTHFASHVPIVRRIAIENQFVLLPVTGIQAQTALFQVDFLDGTAHLGGIRLGTPHDAPQKKGIYCPIDEFTFPPTLDRVRWDDAIPEVIRKNGNSVAVRVKSFTPRAHENTSRGAVTSLGAKGTVCDI
jgi:hypothetical protein